MSDLCLNVREADLGSTMLVMSDEEANPADLQPSLTVAAVARRLGVAPATLRTWDRRYQVGPSSHAAGSHRRYSPTDVERLAVMRRLTLDGVAPAEAARIARATIGDGAHHSAQPDAGSEHAPADPPEPARGSGGRVIALPGVEPPVRGLGRAAMALDAPTAARIVKEHVVRYGTAWTWEHLLVPVLIGIGDRWEATKTGVDVEHVLSEAVLAALRSQRSVHPKPRNARPVLLAGAPGEQHTLPLHVLAGTLEERGIASRVLGARVPTDALAAAVRRSGPCAVFIWAHRAEIADHDQVNGIPVIRPPVAVVVGGPGWLPPYPAGSTCVGTLSEAVAALSQAALGHASDVESPATG